MNKKWGNRGLAGLMPAYCFFGYETEIQISVSLYFYIFPEAAGKEIMEIVISEFAVKEQ